MRPLRDFVSRPMTRNQEDPRCFNMKSARCSTEAKGRTTKLYPKRL